MNLIASALGVALLLLVAADVELRRRGGVHRELVADRARAQRVADFAPVVRGASGYHAARTPSLQPLPPAPREAFLQGRVRAGVVAGAVLLTLTGLYGATRPHHRQLHLTDTLAGLQRAPSTQAVRLLTAQAQQQLDSSSGLADPVIGTYSQGGHAVVVAGARVVHGDGVREAIAQLAQVVGVSALDPRPDGSTCGPLQSPDGDSGTACLRAAGGVVVGVLVEDPAASEHDVSVLATRVADTGVH